MYERWFRMNLFAIPGTVAKSSDLILSPCIALWVEKYVLLVLNGISLSCIYRHRHLCMRNLPRMVSHPFHFNDFLTESTSNNYWNPSSLWFCLWDFKSSDRGRNGKNEEEYIAEKISGKFPAHSELLFACFFSRTVAQRGNDING